MLKLSWPNEERRWAMLNSDIGQSWLQWIPQVQNSPKNGGS